jgi:hypothetical protein
VRKPLILARPERRGIKPAKTDDVHAITLGRFVQTPPGIHDNQIDMSTLIKI